MLRDPRHVEVVRALACTLDAKEVVVVGLLPPPSSVETRVRLLPVCLFEKSVEQVVRLQHATELFCRVVHLRVLFFLRSEFVQLVHVLL